MSYEDFYEKESSVHYYDGEPRTFNNIWLGIAIFLVLPVVTLFTIIWFSGLIVRPTFDLVVDMILHNNSPIFMQLFVASFLPSLIGFFIVYKQERWKLAYGAGISTILFFIWFILRITLR